MKTNKLSVVLLAVSLACGGSTLVLAKGQAGVGGGAGRAHGMEGKVEKKGVKGREQGKHKGAAKKKMTKHKGTTERAVPAVPAKPAVPTPGTPGAIKATPAAPAIPSK